VLAILVELAGHAEGVSLEEMSRLADSPKSTVHRALATLTRFGFAARDQRGQYLLGDEFLRLAFAHHEARPDSVRISPVLKQLAEQFGETAHYAVLAGFDVVYHAKADPPYGAVKLTSTVGGRNPAHTTAVGKLMLAQTLPDDGAVASWAAGRKLERRTEHSLGTVKALAAELALVRARGYATDDQENDPGIVCVAVPVFLNSPTVASGGVSVSAPAYRSPLSGLVRQLPQIRRLLGPLTH
jgi:IclR family acetate operon transcriptional repressor